MTDPKNDRRLRLAALEDAEYPEPVVVASECDLYGHDYQVRDVESRRHRDDCKRWQYIERMPHDCDYGGLPGPRVPESVFCPRCGLSWKVER